MEKKMFWDDLSLIVVACLTLGLAPFLPEPHIVGKIRWVAGGAVGMKAMDWLDFIWHGIPWILLFRIGVVKGLAYVKKQK